MTGKLNRNLEKSAIYKQKGGVVVSYHSVVELVCVSILVVGAAAVYFFHFYLVSVLLPL
jgi:hypothetical protein